MTFRVCSYNIQEGGGDRLAALTGVIGHLQPDALALVEANDRAVAERLAGEFDMHLVFGEANCAAHIAWLSRFPILHWENYHPLTLAKTLLAIEIAWSGVPLHLFATHLGSRWDRPQPATEIPVILDRLRRLGDVPHILVGDCNALAPQDPVGTRPDGVVKRGDAVEGSPRLAIRALLDAGYTDCYRALHSQEPGYTYPATHPWLRLDHVFASSQLAIHLAACDVGSDAAEAHSASDHLPLWASFR